MVADTARPSRVLCGSTRRDGTARTGGLPNCFLRHLPHCGDGELRISRPGFGQAVSGGARFDQPIRAGGAHQWVGSDLVHDRLCAVRRRHDQDFDNASLVRCPSSGGRSRSFTWFRYSTACHDCRLADRDSRQRVSRRRARLGGLSAPAHRPLRTWLLQSRKRLHEHGICGEARHETSGHCAPRTSDHLSDSCHTRRAFLCRSLWC